MYLALPSVYLSHVWLLLRLLLRRLNLIQDTSKYEGLLYGAAPFLCYNVSRLTADN